MFSDFTQYDLVDLVPSTDKIKWTFIFTLNTFIAFSWIRDFIQYIAAWIGKVCEKSHKQFKNVLIVKLKQFGRLLPIDLKLLNEQWTLNIQATPLTLNVEGKKSIHKLDFIVNGKHFKFWVHTNVYFM